MHSLIAYAVSPSLLRQGPTWNDALNPVHFIDIHCDAADHFPGTTALLQAGFMYHQHPHSTFSDAMQTTIIRPDRLPPVVDMDAPAWMKWAALFRNDFEVQSCKFVTEPVFKRCVNAHAGLVLPCFHYPSSIIERVTELLEYHNMPPEIRHEVDLERKLINDEHIITERHRQDGRKESLQQGLQQGRGEGRE
jgi:hypothetical protein